MARTRTVTIEARRRPAAAKPPLAGNRGWLLVYIICLAIELVHGLGLTVATLIIYGNPSLAGLHSFVPLWALLVYVVTNIALVAYGVVVLVLMAKKRKAAIINNIAFNILSVAVVVCWHFIGAKSHLGTILDSLPGLVGLAYVCRSRRVRNTFTAISAKSITAPSPTAASQQ